MQKGIVVREIGFGFGEVRSIIPLVIVLSGRLDANLETCECINVLKFEFNGFQVEILHE